MLLTFGMVCLAWVFFRAQTFRDAFRMIAAMLGMATPDHPFHLDTYDSVVATAIVGGLVATHWILRDRRIEDLVAVTPWLLRGAWLGAMLAAIAMMPGESRAFIYFRF